MRALSVELLALMDQITIVARLLGSRVHILCTSFARNALAASVFGSSADNKRNHVHLDSACLWSPVRCMVSQGGILGRLGYLLRGLASCVVCAGGSSIYCLSCAHWGQRWGSHRDRSDDCEWWAEQRPFFSEIRVDSICTSQVTSRDYLERKRL